MLEKLSILYALMSNFVVKLNKDHAKILINLIATTDIGKVLLQLSNKMGNKSSEWETAFLIVSRNDGNMYVVMVLDKKERFMPFIQVLESLQIFLNNNGIKLELEEMSNFSKTEWIPF